MRKLLLLFLTSLLLLPAAYAQPQREIRGVWLTSVYNIDWPQSSSVSAINQQNRLRAMLNTLEETNINTVFFQVRPNADALYRSNYEPWSHWITGTRGQEPTYDPLAFLIQEAHKRGIEVHAWLNPYRFEITAGQFSGRPGDYSQTHPHLIINHNNRTYFNPGIPETTQLIKSIIADMVQNYELDGVVFDDYFYPSGLPFTADQDTYETYGTDEFVLHYYGNNTQGNFRRAAVNHMIREVNDTLKSIDPSMVFGVSPAGIYSTQASAATHWGTTLPSGITGNDNYNTIYCDPLAWLNERSVDYISPQLYWPHGGGQDYKTLAEWWGNEAARKDRHCYISMGTYRLPADAKSLPKVEEIPWYLSHLRTVMELHDKYADKSAWTLQEIEDQIMVNRANIDKNVLGSVFYSTRDLTSRVPNLAPFLAEGVFSEKAIFPELPWLPSTQTSGPQLTEIGRIGDDVNAAALNVSNTNATRFLLYGWENMPAKILPDNSDFMQVVFGNKLAMFYPGDNRFFAVAEYLPNREIGNLSAITGTEWMDFSRVISPVNATICHNHTFSWEEVQDANNYQIMIAPRSNPNAIIYQSEMLDGEEYNMPSGVLDGQENFIFRVKSFSNNGVSWSAPASFFTGYPLSTILNAPAHNAENVNMTTTMQWNPIAGATHYHLQVATDASFDPESLVIDEQSISNNIFSASLQDSETQHYARIRAVNSCGFSTWSSVNSFTTTQSTSIDEAGMIRLQAFPNPAGKVCSVIYPSPVGPRTIQWFGVNGQLVMQKQLTDSTLEDQFDISGLGAGFYSVRILTQSNEMYVFKIIKSR